MSSPVEEVFLSVVIPAYNEENQLGDTLDRVIDYLGRQDYSWEVLVVDDGSKDNTEAVVKARSIHTRQLILLQYGRNRGKGFAVRYGMGRATGKYRLFMDADNSTAIDNIEAFWPFLTNDQCDIVVGSRKAKGAEIVVHQPWWRQRLGDMGSLWIRLWAVPGILDTQAGFKVFRAGAADALFPLLTLDGWGFDIELLAVARKMGCQISERPIRWVNHPSSRVTIRSYFEVLWEVVKVRRNLWAGKYEPQID